MDIGSVEAELPNGVARSPCSGSTFDQSEEKGGRKKRDKGDACTARGCTSSMVKNSYEQSFAWRNTHVSHVSFVLLSWVHLSISGEYKVFMVTIDFQFFRSFID